MTKRRRPEAVGAALAAFALCAGLGMSGVTLAAETADLEAGADDAEVRLTYGPIGPYDTLWSIARRVRPGQATIEQTMAALVRLNPGAFIDGDRNRIRGGMILRVPSEGEAMRAASFPPRSPAPAAEIVDTAPALPEEPPVTDVPAVSPTEGPMDTAVTPAETEPPPIAPEPLPEPVSDGLEEALAERDRLAEENAALMDDLDRALGDLARAADEIEALEEVVGALELQVETLQQRPPAVPQGRAASRSADSAAPAFSFMAWGAVALLLLAAAFGVVYQRRRVRALEAARDAYRGPSATAEELADEVEPDLDFEEPPPVAQDAPTEPYQPAETYEAASYEPAETDEPAETYADEEPYDPEEEADDAADSPAGPGGYSPNTKLNLARAYVNMGDEETAREVLEEVLAEGDATERAAAQELLDELE